MKTTDYILEPFHLDEKIESIVRQTRLQRIEREFKSLGSLIDNRHVFPLEEPLKPSKISLTSDQEKILGNLRRNGVIEHEVKIESDHVNDAAGHNFTQNDDFKDEETIWKSKSSDPRYFIRRRYDHPELQAFFDSMSYVEKRKFKEQAYESVVKLARRCRKDIEKEKQRMDENGIFHPDANAHRAHCMYLLKINRGITCATIEDPILIALKQQKEIEIEERNKLFPPISPSQAQYDMQNSQNLVRGKNLLHPIGGKDSTVIKGSKKVPLSIDMKPAETIATNIRKHSNPMLASPKLNHVSIKGHDHKNTDVNYINNIPLSPTTMTTATKVLHKTRRKVSLSPTVKNNNDDSNNNKASDRFWKGPSNEHYEVTAADRKMLRWMKTQILQRNLLLKSSPSDNKLQFGNMRSFKGNPLSSDIPDNIDFITFYTLFREYQQSNDNLHDDDNDATIETMSTASCNIAERRTHPRHIDGADRYEDLYSYDRRRFTKKSSIIPPTIIKKKNIHNNNIPITSSMMMNDMMAIDHQPSNDDDGSDDDLPYHTTNIDINPTFLLFAKTLSQGHNHDNKPLLKLSIRHVKSPKIKNISLLGKNTVDGEQARTHAHNHKILATGFINHFVNDVENSDDESEYGSSANDASRKQSMVQSLEGPHPNDTNISVHLQPIMGTLAEEDYVAVSKPKRLSSKFINRKDMAADKEVNHHDMLLEIWAVLEYPFQSRLTFMRKYSTIAYATELCHAIEVWQEAAVLVLIKQIIVDAIIKLDRGYCVPPYSMYDLKDHIIKRVPEEFLSSTSLATMSYQAILDMLPEMEDSIDDINAYSTAIHSIDKEVSALLMETARNATTELQDEITIGTLPIKQWIEHVRSVT